VSATVHRLGLANRRGLPRREEGEQDDGGQSHDYEQTDADDDQRRPGQAAGGSRANPTLEGILAGAGSTLGSSGSATGHWPERIAEAGQMVWEGTLGPRC
jgi:hypothetical protein